MDIKIKKLHQYSIPPAYAHPGDAGMDLFAVEDTLILSNTQMVIETGIAMEIPSGYAGLICDKSGLAINHGMKTIGGVIDSGYRGEIKVGVRNFSDKDYALKRGEKIAQILIQKVECARIVVAPDLTDTSRGANGFGSTGR